VNRPLQPETIALMRKKSINDFVLKQDIELKFGVHNALSREIKMHCALFNREKHEYQSFHGIKMDLHALSQLMLS
jgi:hypothetical protein